MAKATTHNIKLTNKTNLTRPEITPCRASSGVSTGV
jgi:hypothetical protein